MTLLAGARSARAGPWLLRRRLPSSRPSRLCSAVQTPPAAGRALALVLGAALLGLAGCGSGSPASPPTTSATSRPPLPVPAPATSSAAAAAGTQLTLSAVGDVIMGNAP